MPISKKDLPGTLKRSPEKAQRTFIDTLESAEESYGPGERARRTAYSALKHSFEKVGDRWEPKQRRGPSDPQAKQGGRKARDRPRKTAGGVDVEGHTKDELVKRARRLGIKGAAGMKKADLGRAIARKQD
jgi:ChaB